MITIEVRDRPAPQGSKRFVGRSKTGRGIMIESSAAGVGTWREAVKTATLKELENWNAAPLPVFDKGTPVRLDLAFYFDRPGKHYRTGRNSHMLRDDAPDYVVNTPDLSKLIRSTEDALTAAGLWWDDAQVVDIRATQTYRHGNGDWQGALIVISRIGGRR